MRRAILSVVAGLGLSAIGFFIAATQINQPPRIVEMWPILLAVLATFMAWFLQGSIIALLSLPGLKKFQPFAMTRVYLATQAAGAITPFAGGEIAYQLLELDRQGLSAEDAGAVITIRSIMNGVVLISGTAVAVFFVHKVPFLGKIHITTQEVVWGAAIVAAVAIAALVVVGLYKRQKRRAERDSEDGSRWFAKVSGYVDRLKNYFRHMKESLLQIWHQEPKVVIGCFGLMVIYWLIYPLLGTLALRAAGWDGSGWIHIYLAQFVLFLVIPLAPTPGNSGAAELAFVALMGAYVPHGALLGGVIIWRILNHYSEQVIGSFIAGRNLPENIKVAKREFGSGES